MSNKTQHLSAAVFAACFALLVASCGSASPSATSAPAVSAPAAASATSTTEATSTSTSTSAVAATPATEAMTATAVNTATAASAPMASASQSATPKIVAAANAFLATLDSGQKSSVSFDWTNTAQKQRWSNFPQGLFTRAGIMWGNLSAAQQNAWLAVMQATLSTEGYNRVMAEWNADDVLAAQGGGGQLQFGKKYYWIALIGAPSETSPWQWQWGGHHVTVNATMVGSNISLTPSFIGCQPCTYTDASGKSVRPLGDIEDEAFALVNSLDATQQKAAILGPNYIDLVLGPGQDGKVIQPEGLPASQLNADQQAALLKLIGHYTGLVYDAAAAARMAEVKAALAQTYLAWYGPTTKGSAVYFRIAGPTVAIEYSPQQLGGNAANHIHGIYRDPTNDYGAKYTK